jgi:hypothetical protein
MRKQFNADSGYADMDAFAPAVIDEIVDQAGVDEDIALGDLEPWEFPQDEDDPE